MRAFSILALISRDKSLIDRIKGYVSSSIPFTCRNVVGFRCRYFHGLSLSLLSWSMKIATTEATQETASARLMDETDSLTNVTDFLPYLLTDLKAPS